jgi:Hg(II)-responsive transcriptional regulator
MNEGKPYTIGSLARAAGVGIQTVRFYERKGLLARPPRSGPAYRQYNADHVSRIRFIKRAQELGFSLKEITALLGLTSNPRTTCAEVKTRADRKRAEIDAKIRDLQRMKRSLEELSKACTAGKRAVTQCRVADCFMDYSDC